MPGGVRFKVDPLWSGRHLKCDALLDKRPAVCGAFPFRILAQLALRKTLPFIEGIAGAALILPGGSLVLISAVSGRLLE